MREWYGRRSPVARRLLAILTAVAVTGSVLWFTPTGYYVTAPGAAIRTDYMIEVEGGQDHPGRLMLLVVAAQPANLFWYLYAKLDRRAELETPRQFLGTIPNFREYVKLSQAMMQDSQQTAKAIALQVAGKGAGVRPAGVAILGLVPGAPAAAVLREGDIILSIAGRPVTRAEELRDVTRTITPGDTVPVIVLRNGQRVALQVPTYEDPERKGAALVGATIKTEYEFDIPLEIRIKSGQITGPSAGLMFALTIIDQLTEGGITGGLSIAGTGTINPDGSIGVIGGARQKAVSAELAGAHVLFVPTGNYAEAASAVTRLRVVPVDTIYDAVDWLRANAPR